MFACNGGVDIVDYRNGNISRAYIYPAVLQLNLEQRGANVTFLDAHIHTKGYRKRLFVELHAKSRDPKFRKLRFRRYPHICSYLSSKCKYGLVTSEALRLARIISYRRTFVMTYATLLYVLVRLREYDLMKVKFCVRKVMNRIVPHFFTSVGYATYEIFKKLDFYLENPHLVRPY